MCRLILSSLLMLSACTLALPGSGSGTATESPGALAVDEISVTPLGPPGATSAEAPAGAAEAPAADAEAEPAIPPPEVAAPASGEAADGTAAEEPAAEAAEEGAAGAEATEAEPEAEPAPPLSPEAKACERRDGTWAKTPSGGNVCVRRTRDGGQACTRESQCEGLCLARSGTCAPITPVFGCNEILQDDGRRVTLCLD